MPLKGLEKEGYKIDSYCSLPEIEPQIWFQDKDGYHCWCIVRFLTNIEDIMRDTRGLSRFRLKVKKAVCLLIKTDLC